jgi:ABC-2 type transport system ATP-binding protein
LRRLTGAGLRRRVEEAARLSGLAPELLSRFPHQLSGGQKARVGIARAIGVEPRLLILDEPTSALDPSARSVVLSLVENARSQGQTVIFSGHVLAEVEEVADRVAIMREGRLMHVEDMHSRRRVRMVLIQFEDGKDPSFPDELELSVRERKEGTVLLEHRGELSQLITWLGTIPVRDIAIGTDDLRSLYEQFYGTNGKDQEKSE